MNAQDFIRMMSGQGQGLDVPGAIGQQGQNQLQMLQTLLGSAGPQASKIRQSAGNQRGGLDAWYAKNPYARSGEFDPNGANASRRRQTDIATGEQQQQNNLSAEQVYGSYLDSLRGSFQGTGGESRAPAQPSTSSPSYSQARTLEQRNAPTAMDLTGFTPGPAAQPQAGITPAPTVGKTALGPTEPFANMFARVESQRGTDNFNRYRANGELPGVSPQLGPQLPQGLDIASLFGQSSTPTLGQQGMSPRGTSPQPTAQMGGLDGRREAPAGGPSVGLGGQPTFDAFQPDILPPAQNNGPFGSENGFGYTGLDFNPNETNLQPLPPANPFAGIFEDPTLLPTVGSPQGAVPQAFDDTTNKLSQLAVSLGMSIEQLMSYLFENNQRPAF